MNMRLGGRFWIEKWMASGLFVARQHVKNGITLVGLNDVLDAYFRQQAQSTWRLGLIDNSGFDELAETDTMLSHVGWTEITTYSEANRPLWTPGPASGQSIINPTSAVFTMTATKTINGLFVVNEGTKGGTSGILWSTGSMDTPLFYQEGEIARCVYECGAEGR